MALHFYAKTALASSRVTAVVVAHPRSLEQNDVFMVLGETASTLKLFTCDEGESHELVPLAQRELHGDVVAVAKASWDTGLKHFPTVGRGCDVLVLLSSASTISFIATETTANNDNTANGVTLKTLCSTSIVPEDPTMYGVSPMRRCSHMDIDSSSKFLIVGTPRCTFTAYPLDADTAQILQGEGVQTKYYTPDASASSLTATLDDIKFLHHRNMYTTPLTSASTFTSRGAPLSSTSRVAPLSSKSRVAPLSSTSKEAPLLVAVMYSINGQAPRRFLKVFGVSEPHHPLETQQQHQQQQQQRQRQQPSPQQQQHQQSSTIFISHSKKDVVLLETFVLPGGGLARQLLVPLWLDGMVVVTEPGQLRVINCREMVMTTENNSMNENAVGVVHLPETKYNTEVPHSQSFPGRPLIACCAIMSESRSKSESESESKSKRESELMTLVIVNERGQAFNMTLAQGSFEGETRFAGLLPVPTVICGLPCGGLFVGGDGDDGGVFVKGSDHRYVLSASSPPSCNPVRHMCRVASVEDDEEDELYVCCGKAPQSNIACIRNGVGVKVLRRTDATYGEVVGVWTIPHHTRRDHHEYIVISYDKTTRVLVAQSPPTSASGTKARDVKSDAVNFDKKTQGAAGLVLEDFSFQSGMNLNQTTLAAGCTAQGLLIQVHPTGVRVCRPLDHKNQAPPNNQGLSHPIFPEWCPPDNTRISLGVVNGHHILVTLPRSGRLVHLQVVGGVGDARLVEASSIELPAEASCVSILQHVSTTIKCVVGTYDAEVCVVTLSSSPPPALSSASSLSSTTTTSSSPSLSLQSTWEARITQKIQIDTLVSGVRAIPESVLLYEKHLLVGVRDGSLLSFRWNSCNDNNHNNNHNNNNNGNNDNNDNTNNNTNANTASVKNTVNNSTTTTANTCIKNTAATANTNANITNTTSTSSIAHGNDSDIVSSSVIITVCGSNPVRLTAGVKTSRRVIALCNRPLVITNECGQIKVTPLAITEATYVAAFNHSLCGDTAIFISRRSLVIAKIECTTQLSVQPVLESAYVSNYTFHRATVDEVDGCVRDISGGVGRRRRYLFVITTRRNVKQEQQQQQKQKHQRQQRQQQHVSSSVIIVIDVRSSAVVSEFTLDEGETASDIAAVTHIGDKFSTVYVGTTVTATPSKGRVLCFHQTSTGSLTLVFASRCYSNGVGCVAVYQQEYIVISSGQQIILLRRKIETSILSSNENENKNENENEKEKALPVPLSKKRRKSNSDTAKNQQQQLRGHFETVASCTRLGYITTISCSGVRFSVGDDRDSVGVYTIDETSAPVKLIHLLSDLHSRCTVATVMPSEGLTWCADRHGTFYSIAEPQIDNSDENAMVLDTTTSVNSDVVYGLGEKLSCLQIARLSSGYPADHLPPAIVASVSGKISVLVPIVPHLFKFLQRLQLVVGHPHQQHVAPCPPLLGSDPCLFRSQHMPVNNVIDGDLVSEFLSLSTNQQQQVLLDVATETTTEIAKTIEILEALNSHRLPKYEVSHRPF